MSAIFKSQKFITWTIVTTIAYSIVTTIQFSSNNGILSIAFLLSSPMTIAIVGLMQMVLIWNRQQVRSAWLKMLAFQLSIAIVLQVLILVAGWFSAVMAIATLGKSNVWSSFSDTSTVVLLVFGIVSNAVVQGWGLRQAWRDRPRSRYPHCPLVYTAS
jgi:hypothetical protein